jgi:thioredoxin 1
MQNISTPVHLSDIFKIVLKPIILFLLIAFIGLLGCQKSTETNTDGKSTVQQNISPETLAKGRPLLVDLGATKCIPCKMMAPVLEELKKEYAGSLEVVFIDVWENNQAAKNFGIQSIPTQIFYDATGKELFRHEGFFAKEDILQKWKEYGVNL